MSRARRAAYWAAPSLFCLAVYWLGLRTWFQQDDFAWLSLHLQIREPGDLWAALFSPMAQGTIRPISERAFFLAFYHLFGLDPLPFRLMVFLTQSANLVLLASIAWRLTGSRAAGFFAPMLWIANSTLAVAMSWTSAYNQVLWTFFLLLSFHLFLRHIETGKRGYLAGQWSIYLLGFGVLEANVVYPAVAAAYALCCARRHFRKTLWLFLPAAVYAAVHRGVAPKPETGAYVMHFDTSMLATLWTYWEWAMGPARLALAGAELPGWFVPAATGVLTVVLAGFAVRKLLRREWLAAFLLAWFFLILAPYLPLRDHASDYYLTAPVIGLAMLAAWALVEARRGGYANRAAAVCAAALYLATSVPAAIEATRWNYERTGAVKTLVLGVARAHQLHPDKVLLLAGVDSELFWAGVFDKPFGLVGATGVYLIPGAEAQIEARPEAGDVSDYVLPAPAALRAIEQDRALVYVAGGERLRNVTAVYRSVARSLWVGTAQPQRVDVGHPLFEDQLGPTWHAIEGTHRWMPERATVRLGGPDTPGQKLYISGYCPAQLVEGGPLAIAISVDGHTYPPVTVTRGGAPFEFSFPLPAELAGQESVLVEVKVDRTLVVPGDGRELGLVFGTFAIR